MNTVLNQVGQSLQELARGQSQMIMLLQDQSSLSPEHQHMDEDQWSPVTTELQNPNLQSSEDL